MVCLCVWKRSAFCLSRVSSNCVCKSIVHGGHGLVVAVSGLSGSVRTAVWFARKGWHGSSVRAFFLLLTGSSGLILGKLRFGRFRHSRRFGLVWFVCCRWCACFFDKGMLQLELDVDVDFST